MNKICFVVSSHLTVRSFLLKHFELLSNDFEIFLVGNFENNPAISFPHVKEVYSVSLSRKIDIINDFVSFWKLLFFISKNNFNVVHTITPKAGLIGMLSSFFCGVKIRVHTFTGQVWHTKKGFKKSILIYFDKLVSKLATNIIVDGNSQRKLLLSKNIFTDYKSLVLGYGSICGVDVNKFKENPDLRISYRFKFQISDKHVVFSFLGRLCLDKGVLDLVQAFNKLNINYDHAKLLLIGVDEENIIEIIKEKYSTKDIIFVNHVDNPEELLQVSDIFCLPSYREGFGTSVIEASSLSLPVLVSDTYGLNDAVINNVTGLKHVVGDISDLYNKMEILLLDKNLRRKLGLNGRDFVSANLSSQAISGEWYKFYKNLFD